MESSCSETEYSPIFLPKNTATRTTTATTTTKKKKKKKNQQQKRREEEQSWPKKKGTSGVTLEGYLEATDGNSDQGSDSGGQVGRTKSLTDDDLDELKGCLDLGFGFSYDEIPELCNTLPALELCYSMSQRFLDEQNKSPPHSPGRESPETNTTTHVANWKFSSPGDNPEEVKARLKYWAQAVACTVKLCR